MSPAGRDDETGRFSSTWTNADFLEALRDLGGAGTAKEIADVVGCSKRSAINRLPALEDQGLVRHREVGQTYLWELVEDAEG